MVQVTKADGTKQPYNQDNVRSSLTRAGVDDKTIAEILNSIDEKLFEGISTQEIYSFIHGELERRDGQLASRYNLKKAIMALGPTGYPFEKFFAGILKEYGYKTQTNLILDGSCVQHEIDILAEKDGKRIVIESKFHNRAGTKSDVRSVLYTHARFLDVKDRNSIDEHWLVTNTKATHDAVQYGKCNNMRIISWDKPKDFSVRYLIEKSHLHPITALEHLSKDEVRRLLEEGTVFVKDYKGRNLH